MHVCAGNFLAAVEETSVDKSGKETQRQERHKRQHKNNKIQKEMEKCTGVMGGDKIQVL